MNVKITYLLDEMKKYGCKIEQTSDEKTFWVRSHAGLFRLIIENPDFLGHNDMNYAEVANLLAFLPIETARIDGCVLEFTAPRPFKSSEAYILEQSHASELERTGDSQGRFRIIWQ